MLISGDFSNFKEVMKVTSQKELSKKMLDSQTQREIIQVINQNLSDREIAPIVEKTLSAINVKTLTAAEIKPMIVFFTKINSGIYKRMLSKIFIGVPSQLMIQAAQAGNRELVRLLIENGANVNDVMQLGGFNLNKGVLSGHLNWSYEVTRILIENGFDVHLKDTNGETILHYVSICGYADLALLCLEKGASLNKTDGYGYTPLLYACSNGNVETARLLINKGANLEKRDNGNWTPLLISCLQGHAEVAKLLIEKGALVNAKNNDGYTALMQEYSWHPEIIRLLIENGANVHSKNSKGSTILHKACVYKLTDLARLCIDKGADINAQNKVDSTPLHIACNQGDLVTTRFLLENGADFSIKTEKGNTALYFACRQGNLEVVKALIDKGANVIERNQNGESPLHAACELGKADIVRLLLEKGAKVNEKNRHDVLVRFEKFIKDMYDRAAGNYKENPQTPLHLACQSKNLETVKVLLDNQADINQADLHGTTPLHIACQIRSAEIALELIERGANPHLPNKYNRTPLDIAKEKKLLEIVPPETDEEIEAFLTLKELNDLEKLLQQTPAQILTDQGKIFSYLIRIYRHIKKAERVRKAEQSSSSIIQDWIDLTKLRMEAMRNQIHGILKNNPFSSCEVPDDFRCPIGLNFIKDPVYLIKLDGSFFLHAFDRKNIEQWHETQKSMNQKLTIPAANIPTFNTYISADEIYKERAAEIENKLIKDLYVAIHDHEDQAMSIIAEGIDLSRKVDGLTPLQYAAEQGNLKIVKHLLMLGGDLNIKDDSGKSLLELTTSSKVKSFLQEKGLLF